MSTLKNIVFKAPYREFTGYSSSGQAIFTTLDHNRLLSSFDTESSALRHVVDDLMYNWNPANGTLLDVFRLESKTTDKIYRITQAQPGDVVGLTSQQTGEWKIDILHVFKS